MSSFVQRLESRTFLSASTITSAILLADKSTILADAAALKVDLNSLVTNGTTESKGIATAFKKLPKTDQALLKSFDTVESKTTAALKKETSGLSSAGDKIAGTATSIGVKLLSKVSSGSLSALGKDLASLGTVATAPLATLQAELASTGVASALSSIATELAGASPTLASDAALAAAALASAETTIGTAAAQFVTDVGGLATDLTTLQASAGTYPNIIGSFTGIAHETAGKHPGETATVTLTISSETGGIITGTVTDVSDGGLDGLAGTINLNGKFALKGTIATVSLSGQLTGSIVSGTFKSPDASGKFSLTET